LGAIVLIGTGLGIAFFMVITFRNQDPALVIHVAGIVVLADYVFTATAAIAQPITGILLARETGWALTSDWILASAALYVFVGCFWVPVLLIQKRILTIAKAARDAGEHFPYAVDDLYRIWFLLGVAAFGAMLVILWLMLTTPEF
jgi:uncharacterized membrane protein